jgi:hypothetical protein
MSRLRVREYIFIFFGLFPASDSVSVMVDYLLNLLVNKRLLESLHDLREAL